MKLKTVLTVSAIYLGLIGIGLLLFPRQFGVDAVPPDASPALLALLRLLGGPMVGIAVMNWMARDAAPSPTRNAIVTGNLVGFALVTLNDGQGVPADPSAPDRRLRAGPPSPLTHDRVIPEDRHGTRRHHGLVHRHRRAGGDRDGDDHEVTVLAAGRARLLRAAAHSGGRHVSGVQPVLR
jgi:hypothetical protein